MPGPKIKQNSYFVISAKEAANKLADVTSSPTLRSDFVNAEEKLLNNFLDVVYQNKVGGVLDFLNKEMKRAKNLSEDDTKKLKGLIGSMQMSYDSKSWGVDKNNVNPAQQEVYNERTTAALALLLKNKEIKYLGESLEDAASANKTQQNVKPQVQAPAQATPVASVENVPQSQDEARVAPMSDINRPMEDIRQEDIDSNFDDLIKMVALSPAQEEAIRNIGIAASNNDTEGMYTEIAFNSIYFDNDSELTKLINNLGFTLLENNNDIEINNAYIALRDRLPSKLQKEIPEQLGMEMPPQMEMIGKQKVAAPTEAPMKSAAEVEGFSKENKQVQQSNQLSQEATPFEEYESSKKQAAEQKVELQQQEAVKGFNDEEIDQMLFTSEIKHEAAIENALEEASEEKYLDEEELESLKALEVGIQQLDDETELLDEEEQHAEILHDDEETLEDSTDLSIDSLNTQAYSGSQPSATTTAAPLIKIHAVPDDNNNVITPSQNTQTTHSMTEPQNYSWHTKALLGKKVEIDYQVKQTSPNTTEISLTNTKNFDSMMHRGFVSKMMLTDISDRKRLESVMEMLDKGLAPLAGNGKVEIEINPTNDNEKKLVPYIVAFCDYKNIAIKNIDSLEITNSKIDKNFVHNMIEKNPQYAKYRNQNDSKPIQFNSISVVADTAESHLQRSHDSLRHDRRSQTISRESEDSVKPPRPN